MLHRYINQFIEYCRLADFSVRSIQALAIRLNEFDAFLNKWGHEQMGSSLWLAHVVN